MSSEFSSNIENTSADYAGPEQFIIDGNALAYHILTSVISDEIGFLNQSIQELHRILQTISARGCNYKIVIFHDHFKLFDQILGPQFSTAFSCLVQEIPSPFEFTDIESAEWKEYLSREQFSFILTSIATLRICTNTAIAVIQSFFVNQCLSSGLSVALLSEYLLTEPHAVMAFLIQNSKYIEELAVKYKGNHRELIERLSNDENELLRFDSNEIIRPENEISSSSLWSPISEVEKSDWFSVSRFKQKPLEIPENDGIISYSKQSSTRPQSPTFSSSSFSEDSDSSDDSSPPSPLSKNNQKTQSSASIKTQKVRQEKAHWIAIYAASLSGVTGRVLERQIITVDAKQSLAKTSKKKLATTSKSEHSQSNNSWPKKNQKSSAQPSKKDAIISAQLVKKSEKARERLMALFNEFGIGNHIGITSDPISRAAQEKKLDSCRIKLVALESKLDDFTNKHSEVSEVVYEALLLKIALLFDSWRLASTIGGRNFQLLVELFHSATSLIKSVAEDNLLSAMAKYFLAITCHNILSYVGLDSILKSLVQSLEMPVEKSNGKKEANIASYTPPFEIKMPNLSSNMLVGCSAAEFQLLYCGDEMERMLDSQRDFRVNFKPDGWQREILNHIDNNDSAPTSAGKTFCCFYAMEIMMRSGDDGVVVYIAPSSALANQIAAEIEGRYTKQFKHNSMTIWAILTEDYRMHDPLQCQILVTTPKMFKDMILQPKLAGSWLPRVKRVVFDEIHCLGDRNNDGQVINQLLLMVLCPILALSATVGNIQDFGDSLAEIQKAHGHSLKIVHHKNRYSHLRKFIYNESTRVFKHIHPISALYRRSPENIAEDLDLEPRDTSKLAKNMAALSKSGYLAPTSIESFFVKTSIIGLGDVAKYADYLKKVLKLWMENPDSRNRDSPFIKLVDLLNNDNTSDLNTQTDLINDDKKKSASLASMNDFNVSHTSDLLRDMNDNQLFPALFYSFDGAGQTCLQILESVVVSLDAEEAHFKVTDITFRQNLETLKKWDAESPKLYKKYESELQEFKKRSYYTKEEFEAFVAQRSPKPFVFDPAAIVDAFSYSNKKCGVNLDDIEVEISKLKGLSKFVLQGLRRGVCCHFTGMNVEYLQLVERLFRKGWARVVFCTQTLSLGINMPAKSAVFIGDSPYLTPLSFRQAAGRAGRRGLDLRGNVIFVGLKRERINMLLASQLPALNVNFELSDALVLQLHSVLANQSSQLVASTIFENVIKLEHSAKARINNASALQQSVNRLQESRHISISPKAEQKPSLIGFAGFVCHLSQFSEFGAFAFAKLMQDGVLFEICSQFETRRDQVCHDLLVTISTLFCRRPMLHASRMYEVKQKNGSNFSVVEIPAISSIVLHSLYEIGGIKYQLESLPPPPLDASIESSYLLNAYILDFFKHGRIVSLIRENKLSGRAEAIVLLGEFWKVLDGIRTCLEIMIIGIERDQGLQDVQIQNVVRDESTEMFLSSEYQQGREQVQLIVRGLIEPHFSGEAYGLWNMYKSVHVIQQIYGVNLAAIMN
ncbi:hypothetical protein HK100_011471 [Physocladia obscura]|uniref:Uncharacterized protein n=1 Tax=Physocladia obscura TaxID=109957 RepID=A0AAD5T1D0_9FUNG|nr:hypothetical protein HK100_011471 [Physocladia obscura]